MLFCTHDQNRIRTNTHLELISRQINTEIARGSPAELIYNLHRSSAFWVISVNEELGSTWPLISAVIYIAMLTPHHHLLFPALSEHVTEQVKFTASLKPQSDCGTVALEWWWEPVVLMSAKQWSGEAEQNQGTLLCNREKCILRVSPSLLLPFFFRHSSCNCFLCCYFNWSW